MIFTKMFQGCIRQCMSRILTVRVAPDLWAKAERRAVQLGLDRAGYVRSLIEEDLKTASKKSGHRFASEDLVGAFQLGGGSATNERVRKRLRARGRVEADR